MTGRTIIIISIFGAILIIVNSLIFIYRDQTDAFIQRYIAKITTCGNITDERVCFDKSFCKGIYKPSCPDCEEIEFFECKRITSRDKENTDFQKSLCVQTNGRWLVSARGDYCSCSAGYIFNKLQGCIER